MGLRDDIVNDTITYFVGEDDFKPSDTDIRLVSNEIGDDLVDQDIMSTAQWERISQERTIKLVRTGLRKYGRY